MDFRYTTEHLNDDIVLVKVYKKGCKKIFHRFFVIDNGDWNSVEYEIENVINSLC
jgi:hypothetical protein